MARPQDNGQEATRRAWCFTARAFGRRRRTISPSCRDLGPVAVAFSVLASDGPKFPQKQMNMSNGAMSAFGGKADISRTQRNVCFLPKADIYSRITCRLPVPLCHTP